MLYTGIFKLSITIPIPPFGFQNNIICIPIWFCLIYVSELFMYLVSCGADNHQGSWSPHSWSLCITRDSPQSVKLLWTSDQLVAETSTWQHTTSTTKTKKISTQWGTRTHKIQNRLAEEQRLRLHCSHACYQRSIYYKLLFTTIFKQSITIHIS